MECNRMEDLISPYLDGELTAADGRASPARAASTFRPRRAKGTCTARAPDVHQTCIR